MSGRVIEALTAASTACSSRCSSSFYPAGSTNRTFARLLPCRPLAMLFRDAGAATVTVLHRTSYRELFADANSAEVGFGGVGQGRYPGREDIRQCPKQRCS